MPIDCIPISVKGLDEFDDLETLYFIRGDVDRPNFIFAPFKLVHRVYLETREVSALTKNLEIIDKAWLLINELVVSIRDIEMLYESLGERLQSLKVNKLTIVNDFYKGQISDKAVEVINLINPCTSYFEDLKWSYATFKMLFSLNSENIEAEFGNYWSKSKSHILKLTGVNLAIFNSRQNHSMKLMRRSIVIEVAEGGFKGIRLLKAYKFSNSDCLVIPLKSILKLMIFDYKVDKSSTKNDNQLDLINEDTDISQGLIIPVNQLSLATFYSSFRFNSWKENFIVNELLRKARKVNWMVNSLNLTTKIENIFPDDFNRIKSSFYTNNFINSENNQEIGLGDLELKFQKLSLFSISPNRLKVNFEIIQKLLSSRRTRYNITGVKLDLDLLSKCLTVLSLCEKCPELESVSLTFRKWDKKDEKETIDSAIKEFRRNFGFIPLIEINQL